MPSIELSNMCYKMFYNEMNNGQKFVLEYSVVAFSLFSSFGAYRMVLEPGSVRVCVRAFTFSKIFFSETAWPIKAKFYMRHLWVERGEPMCI